MKQNKENNINITLNNVVVVMVCILGLLILLMVNVIIVSDKLDKIPKTVCHDEVVVNKIVLEEIYCPTFFNTTTCLFADYYYLRFGETFRCEEGVEYDFYVRKLSNFGDESKTCLITSREEVCVVE